MKRQVLSKRGTKLRNLNRRRAIRQHCHMCCNFDWNAVKQCKDHHCPLHAYRPGRAHHHVVSPEERAMAIGRYCLTCAQGDPIQRRQCEALTCALYPYRIGIFDPSV